MKHIALLELYLSQIFCKHWCCPRQVGNRPLHYYSIGTVLWTFNSSCMMQTWLQGPKLSYKIPDHFSSAILRYLWCNILALAFAISQIWRTGTFTDVPTATRFRSMNIYYLAPKINTPKNGSTLHFHWAATLWPLLFSWLVRTLTDWYWWALA